MLIDNKTRWFEITAVIITGLFKFIFVNVLELQLLFIIVSIVFWASYIAYRYTKNSSLLDYWGFTKNNFLKSFKNTGIFALICIVIFITYGIYNQFQVDKLHLLYVLILYPIWGTIQQFMVMSLVLGNLKDMVSAKIPLVILILISSLLFSAVHIPSLTLMLITFILALYYSQLFLKFRNLLPLGLFHGMIGGFYYYYVLNQDPWLDVIRMFSGF